jgi:hypothetical protein
MAGEDGGLVGGLHPAVDLDAFFVFEQVLHRAGAEAGEGPGVGDGFAIRGVGGGEDVECLFDRVAAEVDEAARPGGVEAVVERVLEEFEVEAEHAREDAVIGHLEVSGEALAALAGDEDRVEAVDEAADLQAGEALAERALPRGVHGEHDSRGGEARVARDVAVGALGPAAGQDKLGAVGGGEVADELAILLLVRFEESDVEAFKNGSLELRAGAGEVGRPREDEEVDIRARGEFAPAGGGVTGDFGPADDDAHVNPREQMHPGRR